MWDIVILRTYIWRTERFITEVVTGWAYSLSNSMNASTGFMGPVSQPTVNRLASTFASIDKGLLLLKKKTTQRYSIYENFINAFQIFKVFWLYFEKNCAPYWWCYDRSYGLTIQTASWVTYYSHFKIKSFLLFPFC